MVAGLQALAEAEDAKARDFEVGSYWANRHSHRAACLREAALAVSVGQFRTAEANEAAGMPPEPAPASR